LQRLVPQLVVANGRNNEVSDASGVRRMLGAIASLLR
jgi:hypothetical protein